MHTKRLYALTLLLFVLGSTGCATALRGVDEAFEAGDPLAASKRAEDDSPVQTSNRGGSAAKKESTAARDPADQETTDRGDAPTDRSPSKPSATRLAAQRAERAADDAESSDSEADVMEAALAELAALDGLDETTRDELAADLRRGDPRLAKLLVRQLKLSRAVMATAALEREEGPHKIARSQEPADDPETRSDAEERPARAKHRGAKTTATPVSSRRTARTERVAADADSSADDEVEEADAEGRAPTMPRRKPTRPSAEAPATETHAAEAHATEAHATEAHATRDPKPEPTRSRPPEPAAASKQDWRGQLGQVIAELDEELTAADGKADEERQARLRLLLLAAGRRDDALRPIAEVSGAQQDYWNNQLMALSSYLDRGRQPELERRAAEAAGHLDAAAASLGEQGLLQLKNLAFCSEVKSFGIYTQLEKTEFQPGQKLFIYWEVENFKSESTPKGYHTSLKSSCQIFDAQGHRVDQQEFPLAEERCRNRRRDFFICYYLWLPERIYDGAYTLQLTTTDQLNGKVAQSSIEFKIKAQPKSK